MERRRARPKAIETREQEAVYRRLYEAGWTHAALARKFGININTSVKVRNRLGLPERQARPQPPRPTVRATPESAPEPSLRPTPTWTPDRDARLAMAKGYADLAPLVARWNLPHRHVQARWHLVRGGA